MPLKLMLKEAFEQFIVLKPPYFDPKHDKNFESCLVLSKTTPLLYRKAHILQSNDLTVECFQICLTSYNGSKL